MKGKIFAVVPGNNKTWEYDIIYAEEFDALYTEYLALQNERMCKYHARVVTDSLLVRCLCLELKVRN